MTWQFDKQALSKNAAAVKQVLLWSIIGCLATLLSSCRDQDPESKTTGVERVIGVENDDAEMNAAMEAARASFEVFRSAVEADRRRPVPALQMISVKAYFADESEPDEGEHLWIADISFRGEEIIGVVASDPLDLDDPDLGDEVSLPLSQLSDWLYVEDGKASGAFTVQLLRSRMSDEEREAHDSNYSFTFPPIDS